MFAKKVFQNLCGKPPILHSHFSTITRLSNKSSIGLYTETIASNRSRDKYRPLKIAFLGSIPVITLFLGWWQLQRLEWKENLLATIKERSLAQPVLLNRHILSNDFAKDLEYRTVLVEGEFLHDREILVGPRAFDNQSGYYVVTPLKLDNGYVVLVRRGWISRDKKDPRSRRSGQTEGVVLLKAQIRTGEKGNSFTPLNVPEEGKWFYFNVEQMAEDTGSLPILLEQITDDSPYLNSKLIEEGFPVPRQLDIYLSNNHAQYAFTWLSLSVLTAIMTIMFARSGGRRLPSSKHHPLAKNIKF